MCTNWASKCRRAVTQHALWNMPNKKNKAPKKYGNHNQNVKNLKTTSSNISLSSETIDTALILKLINHFRVDGPSCTHHRLFMFSFRKNGVQMIAVRKTSSDERGARLLLSSNRERAEQSARWTACVVHMGPELHHHYNKQLDAGGQ